MIWDVSTDPLDPEDAIAWFRELVPMTDEQYAELIASARDRAFRIAGVAQLDIISQVWKALDRAISQGTSLEDFKADVSDSLTAAWHGTVVNPGFRVETIFRTNLQNAYQAGRVSAARDVEDDRPYWLFDATIDDRTSPECEAANGTLLPADDPWWSTHTPPLHQRCRSSFITLTGEQAEARGVTRRAPHVQPDSGFGRTPSETNWSPNASDYPEELWNEFEKKQNVG